MAGSTIGPLDLRVMPHFSSSDARRARMFALRRRELIVDVVVAAILWPYTVRAQQKSLPVIRLP